MQLDQAPIIDRSAGGGSREMPVVAHHQVPLALETGDSTILVGVDFVRAIRKCDAESVFSAVDNVRHPKHIRFAFNLGDASAGRRELRFWTTEILAPDFVKNLSIDQALAEIVGVRETFPRGFLEIQWVIGATHIGNLVQAGELLETGNRFLNTNLKNFLRRRWIGYIPSLDGGKS